LAKVGMKKIKFVVEKHRDSYVAYPLGLKAAVVAEGDSYESALADAKSAAAFHIESFGKEAFDDQDDVMEAFVTEAFAISARADHRCVLRTKDASPFGPD
jgi:hypothetical protein